MVTASVQAGALPPAYWRLWWASAVDNVGDGAFATAIPLLALRLTTDPLLISAVSAATFVPWLVLSLPVGALVDRRDKIRVMWCSQLVQAVGVSVLALVVVAGVASVGLLVAVALLLGTCEVFFGNAAQAVLADIVAAPLLVRANGYANSVLSIGQQFIGPPLGSLLFGVASVAPFALNAASFVGSAALLSGIPATPHDRAEVDQRMWHAVAEGLRWLFAHRLLRTLAVLLGLNTFCFSLATSTQVLLAVHTLHVTPRGYGVLLGAVALGSVVGGVVNSRFVDRVGPLAAIVTSLAATALLFVCISLAPNAVVLGVLLAMNGFAVTMWNVIAVSIRQQRVPAGLRGRVNGAYRMIGWGPLPLGALAGGAVVSAFGNRAAFATAGVVRGLVLAGTLRILVSELSTRSRAGSG